MSCFLPVIRKCWFSPSQHILFSAFSLMKSAQSTGAYSIRQKQGRKLFLVNIVALWIPLQAVIPLEFVCIDCVEITAAANKKSESVESNSCDLRGHAGYRVSSQSSVSCHLSSLAGSLMWLNKRIDAGRARKHLNKICSCGWWERKFPSCFFVSALGCRCTCASFSSSQHLHFTLGETHMSRRHFVRWTDNWHRARWPCSYWEIFILFSFPGCQILLSRQTCSYLHKHKASFGICAQRVSQHQLVTYKAPVHLGSIYSLYILLYFQVITSLDA